MFACLHLERGPVDALPRLAEQFSPFQEVVDERTVLIPVYGLGRLLGSLEEIGALLQREAAELSIHISLAMANHPDTAQLAARHIEGLTILTPGRELDILGPLPVEVLPAPLELLQTLVRWGVETIAAFAELPPLGVIERLGDEGGRLQALVEGRGTRPLRIRRPPEDYTASVDVEEPLLNLEPLLFLASGMIHDIVKRLATHGLVVGSCKLSLSGPHECRLQFPAPMHDPVAILKLLRLELEAHRPRKPIARVTMELQPTLPQTVQHGLFTPSAPEPAQLQTLLARLRAISGSDSVGSPELENTHRPDAWRLRQDVLFAAGRPAETAVQVKVGFRCFRPALQAKVAVDRQHRPARVEAKGVTGHVLAAKGPWRTSGEWWAQTVWARDEWDVELEDGALYRLYREQTANRWFVEGVYD